MKRVEIDNEGKIIVYAENGRIENGKEYVEISGDFLIDNNSVMRILKKSFLTKTFIDIRNGTYISSSTFLTKEDYDKNVKPIYEKIKELEETSKDLLSQNKKMRENVNNYNSKWYHFNKII